jgi:hypothetical protein
MVDQTGQPQGWPLPFARYFHPRLVCHPPWKVGGGVSKLQKEPTMNAKARFVVTAHLRLQHFLAQYYTRTPRLVFDQTTPRNTYKPHYVAHRDVTPRRKGGAK